MELKPNVAENGNTQVQYKYLKTALYYFSKYTSSHSTTGSLSLTTWCLNNMLVFWILFMW